MNVVKQTGDRFHLLTEELRPAAVKKILGWRDHPELGRLVSKLLSHTSRKAFLDSYAEAMVALHLMANKCDLRFEVPTPQGKRCDFEVRCGGQLFYLHVKRLDSEPSQQDSKQFRAIASRLRTLERIQRPYIVQVRWNEPLSKEQIRMLVNQARDFITNAKVGEEMTARDAAGRQIGGVRIVAPWQGSHVNVMIGLRNGAVDQAPRFYKLMERAAQQFMPRAVNVILIGSDQADDQVDFESALLGTHVERWDAFPPRGKRIAHGRAADGFWAGRRFSESQYAAWFHFAPQAKKFRAKLWVRDQTSAESEIAATLDRLFDTESA